MSNLPPPPTPPRHAGRRPDTKSTSVYTDTTPVPTGEKPSWKEGLKAKSKVWGSVALEKGIKISDQVGARVNNYAEKTGNERFWPTTGDFPQEIEKCARILKAFTVEGIPTEVVPEIEDQNQDQGDGTTKKKAKKPVKLLRKIPPKVISEAVGLAIFTNFRTAIAPFGGSGGAGVVIARLPDGSWSPPSSISPNNYAAGLVYGVDIFDAVVVIRTQKAMETFYGHKATLGADIGVVAGPFGAGAVVESGKERAPVYSYVKSRGLYAGISILGQVFVERYDENGKLYHWPGVKAQDILTGKVRMPREAANLMEVLKDAESGKAQRQNGDGLEYVEPNNIDQLDLNEGEVLKLPPTPDMVDPDWGNEDPDATKVHRMSSGYNTPPTQSQPHYPASGSASPVPAIPASTSSMSGSGMPTHPVPPRLPPRFKSDASSVSAYSSADDGEGETPSGQHLPPPPHPPPSVPASTGGLAVSGSGMDESERREYEQHLEMLRYEAELAEGSKALVEERAVPIPTSTPGFESEVGAGAGAKAAGVDLPPTYMHPADGTVDQQVHYQHDVDLDRQMEKMSVTGTPTSR